MTYQLKLRYKDVKVNMLRTVFVFMMMLMGFAAVGQEEETNSEAEVTQAEISLTFSQTDSTRTCIAIVTAGGLPVKEKEVRFYVKRLYSLLPIEDAVETDEFGEALVEFPLDLPGDELGMLNVVARIEDDDTYGTVQTKATVKWGALIPEEGHLWGGRSLSASRDKAPLYLIIVSNLIIAAIWGVIIYVIFQIFRIKKASRLAKK